MRIRNFFSKNDYISAIVVLYCVCIVSSTLVRWMNYCNIIGIVVSIIYILKTRKIIKSFLCILWSIFIFVYPICDAAIRGENGLSLFTMLCYLTPMLLLLIGGLSVNDFNTIVVKFIKYFAWFQAFGILLDKIWSRLHIILAWRILGMWSYNVTGFATDATVTAYILCFGIGVYFIDYWLLTNKMTKEAWKSLLFGVILFWALVLTNKRSFLFAITIALICAFLGQAVISRKKFVKTIGGGFFVLILGCILCFGAYSMGMSNALGRMGETFIGLSEGTDVTSMRSVWASYMNEWRQGSEVFGIGWESFINRLSYTAYAGKVPNGHNVYLQILCEEGYVGELIFIVLLVITVIMATKNVISLANGDNVDLLRLAMFAMFTVILFTIYCYSGNAIYDAVIYLYFFMGIQLISVASKSRRIIENAESKY